MIQDKSYINLKKFVALHNSFMEVPTWTKEKHQRSQKFNEYIVKIDSIDIMSKRNSTAHLVPELYSFTVLRVPRKQTGKMKGLRGQWVLLRCDHRELSDYYLSVYKLKKKPPTALLKNLNNCSRYKDWTDHYEYMEETYNR